MIRRAMLILAAVAALLSTQPGTAAATCAQGCAKSSGACKINTKNTAVGCQIGCQDVYDADPGAVNASEDFAICRDACRTAYDVQKDACKTDRNSCRDACKATTFPSCAAGCGEDLFYCAATIVVSGQSCFTNNVNSVNAATVLSGCGSQGTADLLDCYNDPIDGFVACMTNLSCNAVCGDTLVEPGETCDDGDVIAGDGCSSTCFLEDQDHDGILDDGSGNAVPGDSPCPNGVTTGCDDNCPTVSNADQADVDGDNVGDVCDANCGGTITGSSISGGVYANSVAPPNGLAGAVVSACLTGTTCCSHATTDINGLYQFTMLDDGTYELVALAPGNYVPGSTLAPIPVTGSQIVTGADFVLSGPIQIPPGVTLTNSHTDFGIPFIQPFNPLTLTAPACVGATVSYSVRQHGTVLLVTGPMTESPPASGNFEVVITNLGSLLVPGIPYSLLFEITISGCGGPPDGVVPFNAYIDPSGYTRYVDGSGAVGATVTLLKGDSLFGPWDVVPDGSVIMSPKNRVNPDVSDASGHFGWDVISGFYKVTAEISGCTAESEALTIPPEVTDLELVFECPCIGGPREDCRTGGKGQLSFKDDIDDTSDSFAWKWSAGEATSFAEFGSPLSTTAYDVCVYTGVSNELTRLRVPAAAGWLAAGSGGTGGYKYIDSLGLSTGVTSVQFKSSVEDAAKVQVKGKGIFLPDLALGGIPTPVTIQLQPSDLGVCFESVFGPDDVSDNDSEALKLRFP